MALSEQEQRTLDELEAVLAADDPKLAHTLRGSSPARPATPRRASMAAVGMLAGLTGLVAGMQTSPVISVLGFLVMLASGILGIGLTRPGEEQRRAARATHPSQQGQRRPSRDRAPRDH